MKKHTFNGSGIDEKIIASVDAVLT